MADPITCEVEGCDRSSTFIIKDLVEEPKEPDDEEASWARYTSHSTHYFCANHKRDSRTYRRDPDSGDVYLFEDEDGQQYLPDGTPVEVGLDE